MDSGIEIPIREAVIFDLDSASADSFLEQYPACVFLLADNLSPPGSI